MDAQVDIPSRLGRLYAIGGTMKHAGKRAREAPPAATRRHKLKESYLMIRVDEDQKALVEAAADRDAQSTASWARSVLVRLAQGWKLIPPNWKAIPPD